MCDESFYFIWSLLTTTSGIHGFNLNADRGKLNVQMVNINVLIILHFFYATLNLNSSKIKLVQKLTMLYQNFQKN